MTVSPTEAQTDLPPLHARPFTLATDLDGTFLGGSDTDRATLYDWIAAHRATVGLVFVTGRDPEFITGMVRADGLPQPDFVVGDVGTTIARVAPDATLHPIPDLEAEIVLGDARETLSRWDGVADAWFLDGFAPARNPELWEAPLLTDVALHTAPGGTLATYTAAGVVRRGLESAGFAVIRVPGFGRKRHMTLGRLA